MTGRTRCNFSLEFRLQATRLVLDEHYAIAATAMAMNIGKSMMDKWVRKLKEERACKSSALDTGASPAQWNWNDFFAV